MAGKCVKGINPPGRDELLLVRIPCTVPLRSHVGQNRTSRQTSLSYGAPYPLEDLAR